jgi:nitrile hydratase
MTLAPGSRVRVREDWPETRGPCHIRTPHYLRGERGVVLAHLGEFPNPEDAGFGRPAAEIPLYHVRFDQASLWRQGTPGDAVVAEIFGHWLEETGG